MQLVQRWWATAVVVRAQPVVGRGPSMWISFFYSCAKKFAGSEEDSRHTLAVSIR
jgi:hypothetical protein